MSNIKNDLMTDLKNNYVHVADVLNRWPAATRALPLLVISYNNDWDDYNSQYKTNIECSVQDVFIDTDGVIKVKCYDEESMIDDLLWLNEDMNEEDAYKEIDSLDWQPMILIEVYE